jgi:hypothetical protein
MPVLLVSSAHIGGGALESTARSTLTAEHLFVLRGGSDSTQPPPADPAREKVIARLNECPAFCVVNGDGNYVGIQNAEGGMDVIFHVCSESAKEVLELMQAGNPDDGLHLICTPLGRAFQLCEGWVEAGPDVDQSATYKLQSPSMVTDEAKDSALAQLSAQGREVSWSVPVFCCDEFQTDQMMPFFWTAENLFEGWERSGIATDDMPESPIAMDLRMLVTAMLQDENLRGKARVVPSVESFNLAQELLGAQE